METTTSAPTDQSIHASIAAFATAVRARLDDLPADEADELVDGLEADLHDQATDRGDEFTLGDPGNYAEELRAAAGVAPRTEPKAQRSLAWSRRIDTIRAAPRTAATSIRQNRAGAWVLDLLISLRAVWWMARGWAMYALVAPAFGISMLTPNYDVLRPHLGGVILLGAFLLLSVQWGRGQWSSSAWGRGIRIVVSVITVVALPFLVSGSIQAARSSQDYATYVETTPTPGLAVDGERVRNIFAYDSAGNPLGGVQLFTQDGRPLTTVGTQYTDGAAPWDDYFFGGGGPLPVPFTAPGRAPLWNVFPLNEILDPTYAAPDPQAAVIPAFPFVAVPAIEGSGGVPTPSPMPTVTPGAGVLPTPTAEATPEVTPEVVPAP